MLIEEYDVVIVGGGIAGVSLAYNLSKKSQLKVLVIDRSKREKIGDKCCGDIFFGEWDNNHYLTPRNDEAFTIWEGQKIVIESDSVQGESPFDDGIMTDRLKYTQRVLNDCEKQGVKIVARRKVLKPIIEDNFIIGVIVLNQENGKREIYKSRLVADTSGFSHAVRRNIPKELFPNLDKKIPYMIDGYREIIKIDHDLDDHLHMVVPDYFPIGSFFWVMGRGKGYVNVGIYLRNNEGKQEKRKIQEIVRTILHEQFYKEDQYELLEARGCPIPSVIPMTNLVANGFVTFGDAGTQPSPLVGDGIRQALFTGEAIADVVIKSFENGDLSEKGLWEANKTNIQIAVKNIIAYFKLVAFREFGTEGLKVLLKKVPEILGAFFINKDLSLIEQLSAATKLRGTGMIKTLLKIRSGTKSLQKIFNRYPDTPEEYPEWKETLFDFLERFGIPKPSAKTPLIVN